MTPGLIAVSVVVIFAVASWSVRLREGRFTVSGRSARPLPHPGRFLPDCRRPSGDGGLFGGEPVDLSRVRPALFSARVSGANPSREVSRSFDHLGHVAPPRARPVVIRDASHLHAAAPLVLPSKSTGPFAAWTNAVQHSDKRTLHV